MQYIEVKVLLLQRNKKRKTAVANTYRTTSNLI